MTSLYCGRRRQQCLRNVIICLLNCAVSNTIMQGCWHLCWDQNSYRKFCYLKDVNNYHNSWNFRWERIQWNLLGQIAASRSEVFPTFREILPSPSSGNAGGFGLPPSHPTGGDGVTSRNVGKPSHLDAAVLPRKFHWINNYSYLVTQFEDKIVTDINNHEKNSDDNGQYFQSRPQM